MTKKILILCGTLLLPISLLADTFSSDGGRLPPQGTEIGGKGADGLFHYFSTTNTGSLNVTSSAAAATGTRVQSTVYATSLVLKNTAGTLISVAGYNSKASAQWIQLYDSATLPADTAVPIVTFTVPATSNFSYDIPITGMPFAVGIVAGCSSTAVTKTVGSADCFFYGVVQ